jgi:exopolysaccharide biosynthesis polyprenyl glycosylphosphotransferase
LPGRPAAVSVPRRRPPEHLIVALCRALDTGAVIVVLLSGFVLSNIERMPHGLSEFLAVRLTVKNLFLILAFLGAWRVITGWCGLYQVSHLRKPTHEALGVVLACTLGSAVALVFPLLSVSEAFGFITIAYLWAGTVVVMLLIRGAVRSLVGYRSTPRSVVIVGSGPRAAELYRVLRQEQQHRYQVLGFVDDEYGAAPEVIRARTLGSIDELDAVLMRQPVDVVLIALPQRSRYAQIQRTIELCEEAGVQVKYLADAFRVSLARPSFDPSDYLPVITMEMVSDDYRLGVKRVIDRVGALMALVILSPLMLVTALAIKLTSPGPVFFAQERYGRNKHRIRMYKFRTMVADAEALQRILEGRNEAVGPIFKIRDDPRLTPVGRLLRRCSIDELPQLWNVLRGEMSLVGPRPMSLRDVSLFSEPALMRRFSVMPGITGLWQVSGRSNLPFDQWIALDLAYIDRWSLWLDLKILLRTPWAVLTADGAA